MTAPSSPAAAHPGRLTTRQLDALRLAANGYSDPAIGRQLGISPAAATNRLVEAYRRLGVSNRTHAATVAMKLGLIGADEIRLPAPAGPHAPTGDPR